MKIYDDVKVLRGRVAELERQVGYYDTLMWGSDGCVLIEPTASIEQRFNALLKHMGLKIVPGPTLVVKQIEEAK